ncbi:hypothetical protein LZ32DRAFT_322965 [Colletotrichum eremochloae]|nr:hypothetical protein LZ32DRAFT_322965 [Colletotrichum eremochloae]
MRPRQLKSAAAQGCIDPPRAFCPKRGRRSSMWSRPETHTTAVCQTLKERKKKSRNRLTGALEILEPRRAGPGAPGRYIISTILCFFLILPYHAFLFYSFSLSRSRGLFSSFSAYSARGLWKPEKVIEGGHLDRKPSRDGDYRPPQSHERISNAAGERCC